MKKPILKAAVLILAFSLAGAAAPQARIYADTKTEAKEEKEAPAPKLNTKKVTLTEGKSKKLRVKNLPDNTTVKWASSDKRTATVTKNGKVKAKKPGKCTVTASFGDVTLTCKITVKALPDAPAWDDTSLPTIEIEGVILPIGIGWTENYTSPESVSYTDTAAQSTYTYSVKDIGTYTAALLERAEEQEALESMITGKVSGTVQESRKLIEGEKYACVITMKTEGAEEESPKMYLLLKVKESKLITIVKVSRYKSSAAELEEISAIIDRIQDVTSEDQKPSDKE